MLGPVLRVATVVMGAAAVWGAGSLSWVQWNQAGSCPSLLGLAPACYIVLILATVTFAGAVLKRWTLFLLGCLPAIAIALPASLGQAFGWVICPQTTNGIPKCYLSLGLFAVLLVLGLISRGLSDSTGASFRRS